MGCVYFAMLAIKRHDPRYWLWFGIVAGIVLRRILDCGARFWHRGWTVAGQQRRFYQKWIWLGGGSPFSFFFRISLECSESLAFAQLMHNIKADGRDVVLLPGLFRPTNLIVHPILAPIWITVSGLSLLRPAEAVSVSRWCYLATLPYSSFSRARTTTSGQSTRSTWQLARGDREFHRTIGQVWLKPALVALFSQEEPGSRQLSCRSSR